jgi:MFS family permease
MAALETGLADQTGHDSMTEPEKNTSDAGLLGGLLAGLFGVAVGFVVGWLSVGVFIPFSDPTGEARKWLPGIALLCGVGGASVGGVLGVLSGTLFGARATIRAAGTKGLLGGLIGIAAGFVAGVLLSGLADRQWAWLTDGSTSCALLGGGLGAVAGTLLGARAAARAKREGSAPGP